MVSVKTVALDLVEYESDSFVLHMFYLCRYIQVGNAVAVPVARALGYALGQAYRQDEFNGDEAPLFKLPGDFIPTAQATAARRSALGASRVKKVMQE